MLIEIMMTKNAEKISIIYHVDSFILPRDLLHHHHHHRPLFSLHRRRLILEYKKKYYWPIRIKYINWLENSLLSSVLLLIFILYESVVNWTSFSLLSFPHNTNQLIYLSLYQPLSSSFVSLHFLILF